MNTLILKNKISFKAQDIADLISKLNKVDPVAASQSLQTVIRVISMLSSEVRHTFTLSELEIMGYIPKHYVTEKEELKWLWDRGLIEKDKYEKKLMELSKQEYELNYNGNG